MNGIVALLIITPVSNCQLSDYYNIVQPSFSYDVLSRNCRYPVGAMSAVSRRHAVINGGTGLMRCCCWAEPVHAKRYRYEAMLALQELVLHIL